MKILSFTILIAAVLAGFTSCNKQYDTHVSDSRDSTNTNVNGGSGGSSFNWTGTAPFSVKLDGVVLNDPDAVFGGGTDYIGVIAGDGDILITISIPAAATPGQIFSMPTPASISYINGAGEVLGAWPGKVKVVTNDATTLEGYFYADLKDFTGLTGKIIHATEGYFKVTKP